MTGVVKRETDIFSTSEFNPRTTLLLIELTQVHWDHYKLNKTQFYQMLHNEFLAHGYNISAQKIRKKWNNLLVTYKRTKSRTRLSSEARITWEYFEALDNLLSQRVGPPLTSSGPTVSTALFPSAVEQPLAPSPAPCTPAPSHTQSPDRQGTHTDSTSSVTATTSQQSKVPGAKRKRVPSDVTDTFLENYEGHALRRTKVLESLANRHTWRNVLAEKRRENRETRREKREEEMLACLKDISLTLREMSEKQDRIIALLEKRP